MYRINSISKQMISLQVIDNGVSKAVNLLPGNFVFSDKVTDQIRNLEVNGCIRLRENLPVQAPIASTTVTNTEASKSSKAVGTTVKAAAAQDSDTSSK